MRVLYAGLKYNYGKPEEGFSYEHMNVEAGFRQAVKDGLIDELDTYYPDAIDESCALGENTPDLVFHVAFNDSLDLPPKYAMDMIQQGIPVLQWDCDSSWRFQNDIVKRQGRVSHFITTHSRTIPWYEQCGMKVIRSQWAGSPLYKRDLTAEKQYDVSFIGQKHGHLPNGKFVRAEIIDAIRRAGIEVHLFGNYWDGHPNWHGYVTDFHEVPRILNQSKICLNLSNPWHTGTMPQIKGRHFEIPQVGGFQVCTPADDLDSYFEYGKEIAIASSPEELIATLRAYLADEEARNTIAEAGYLRMQADHQWSNRLQAIFDEVMNG
jgi:spore maturation protein CgeB